MVNFYVTKLESKSQIFTALDNVLKAHEKRNKFNYLNHWLTCNCHFTSFCVNQWYYGVWRNDPYEYFLPWAFTIIKLAVLPHLIIPIGTTFCIHHSGDSTLNLHICSPLEKFQLEIPPVVIQGGTGTLPKIGDIRGAYGPPLTGNFISRTHKPPPPLPTTLYPLLHLLGPDYSTNVPCLTCHTRRKNYFPLPSLAST